MSTAGAGEENPWEDVKGTLGGALTTVTHHKPYAAISPARPELSQAGRTVLVAGGSTGIGYSIGESFAAAGAARVILTGRRQEALDAAVSKIAGQYPAVKVVGIVNDYGDHVEVEKLWNGFAKDGIFVDVLVLNASKMWLPSTLLGLGTETVKDGFDFNVIASYFWTAQFHKQREQNPSRKLALLNLTSAVVHMPAIALPVLLYTITKGATAMMLQSVALNVPAEEMQIITFHPGTLYTETFAKFVDKDAMPWDDIKLPGDFAVWAASEEAAFLHGRYLWSHWDVDELKAGPLRERVEKDPSFLTITVKGL